MDEFPFKMDVILNTVFRHPVQDGVCGSRNSRRIGSRATDVKIGNASPKLHWRLWEKNGFLSLARKRYFLSDNEDRDGEIWTKC